MGTKRSSRLKVDVSDFIGFDREDLKEELARKTDDGGYSSIKIVGANRQNLEVTRAVVDYFVHDSFSDPTLRFSNFVRSNLEPFTYARLVGNKEEGYRKRLF